MTTDQERQDPGSAALPFGTPYHTTRTASVEFGPCVAVIHETDLAWLTDEEAHIAWGELKKAHAAANTFDQTGSWPNGWTSERFVLAMKGGNRVGNWLDHRSRQNYRRERSKVGAAR